MLLIDADNVSVDVMEQAVRLVHQQHGGLHVRRAYCTAESAVKHQGAFKRLGIKPMVNLAAGKNSTDIALAVDAIDLVLAERPDVVVIASSDSDFAPLVQRLREKGCVVRGIGQQGKTGDETQDVYDDYTVLEHRKSSGSATDEGAPARKTAARKTAGRKTSAAGKTVAAKKAAKAPAAKKAAATAKAAPAAKTPRKTTARKSVASKAASAPADAPAVAAAPVSDAGPAPMEPTPASAQPAARAAPAVAPKHMRTATQTAGHTPRGARGADHSGVTPAVVFGCLPELAAGQTLALNVAVQRLREARLLGKNASSSKLFAQLADYVELLPADKPTQVRRRA